MFTKYALLAVGLFLVWAIFLRPARGGGRDRDPDSPRVPPPPKPAELAPCPKCGVYKLPGGNCHCTRDPAAQD
jgi:hypothetical protein